MNINTEAKHHVLNIVKEVSFWFDLTREIPPAKGNV